MTAQEKAHREYLASVLANARVYVPGKVTPLAPVQAGVIITGFLAR